MSGGEQNLYELLEVDESAGDREIALAFRRVAKRWHPDLNSTREATERMQHISAAYEVLRDPGRRADYDRALRPRLRPVPTRDTDNTRQHARRPTTSPWWAGFCGSPTVIPDPRPPTGYPTPPYWCSPRPAPPRGARRPRGTAGIEVLRFDRRVQALGVLLLILCPCLPFLLAARSARDGRLARWGALYSLAPVLWGVAAATGSPLATQAGMVFLLAGAGHAFRWRAQLATAIAGSNRGR